MSWHMQTNEPLRRCRFGPESYPRLAVTNPNVHHRVDPYFAINIWRVCSRRPAAPTPNTTTNITSTPRSVISFRFFDISTIAVQKFLALSARRQPHWSGRSCGPGHQVQLSIPSPIENMLRLWLIAAELHCRRAPSPPKIGEHHVAEAWVAH